MTNTDYAAADTMAKNVMADVERYLDMGDDGDLCTYTQDEE